MAFKDVIKKYSEYRAEKLNAKRAKNSKDLFTYVEAIKKIKNENIILDIVMNSVFQEPQIYAVDHIKNKRKLMDIAMSHTNYNVRREAVLNLSDNSVLTDIAKRDNKIEVREAAVIKLTDQNMLSEFAKSDKDKSIRCAAIKNLTDQILLSEIAKSEKISDIRKAAVEKLVDTELLIEFAKKDENSTIREIAVKKLTDQKALTEIALYENNESVRNTVLERILNPSVRAEIESALDDSFMFVALSQKKVYPFLSKYNKVKNKGTSIKIEQKVISFLPKLNFVFTPHEDSVHNLNEFNDGEMKIIYHKMFHPIIIVSFSEIIMLNILRNIGEELSVSWCMAQLQPFTKHKDANNEEVKKSLLFSWDKSPFVRLNAVQITLCYILVRCAEKITDKTIFEVAGINNYVVKSHTEITGRNLYDEYETYTTNEWLLSSYGLFAKTISESELIRRKGIDAYYGVYEIFKDSHPFTKQIKDKLTLEDAQKIKKELNETGKEVIILLTRK